MTLRINAASADIDLVVGQAKADWAEGREIIVFHLTKGFSLAGAEQGHSPHEAFSALGHFKVALGSSVDLTGWQFGFIQLCKLHEGGAYYAGRIHSEGSIAVMFENAMPSRLLLDSFPARTPWTLSTPRFRLDSVASEIVCETGDHPALKVPKKLRNAGRNIQNFLFHVVDKREFWTVLTAIDPLDRRQHLAHFHWEIRYNVMFSWRAGKPIPTSTQSTFILHGKGKGAPADSELQGLLARPVPPLFNIEADNAMLQAFWGPRGVNRVENPFWFINVPDGFFS